jgi:multisubunit Na+/H+ antiporter MnhE subunit
MMSLPSLTTAALAVAILLLWLFLARDASPAQLLAGAAVGSAVAAWARLLG